MIAELVSDKIPQVLNIPPPPPYPVDATLGRPPYHVETAWQSIIEGMSERGLAVRIFSVSDRSNLYKTAARMGITLQTRHTSIRPAELDVHTRKTLSLSLPDAERARLGLEAEDPSPSCPPLPCWIAQVVDKDAVRRASSQVALDMMETGGDVRARGRFRSLAMLVLERGSLTFPAEKEAERVHHSLRRFVRRNQLAKFREQYAVAIEPAGEGGWKVSVTEAIQKAYAKKAREIESKEAGKKE